MPDTSNGRTGQGEYPLCLVQKAYCFRTQEAIDLRLSFEVARLGGISLDEALQRVYESRTYVLMSEGIADMHCRSDRYLAEEILTERA